MIKLQSHQNGRESTNPHLNKSILPTHLHTLYFSSPIQIRAKYKQNVLINGQSLVAFQVVPGLTFELCQSGNLPDDVKERFVASMRWLVEEKDVSCITGDCGFMIYFQQMAQLEVK